MTGRAAPEPGASGPVLVDVQATQSAGHRDRGVARYTAELAAALWRTHRPLVHSFLLNPDLAPPGAVEPLVASGRLTYSDRVHIGGGVAGNGDGAEARLLHVVSPIELDVPIGRLWPAAAATRGLRLVVTLYDLIPEIFAERYLADPGLRRRYRARLELVRAADLVLAISDTTAHDAVERLHIPEERIVVVGAAAGETYSRPAPGTDALAAARGRGSRARTPLRALHGRHGRPEELPRPVPGVGAAVTGRARHMAARDGVQHGRPDPQSPRAPRARRRHRVAPAAPRIRARLRVAVALPVGRPVRVPVALRGIRAADRRGARFGRADHRVGHLGGRRAARARSAVRPRE